MKPIFKEAVECVAIDLENVVWYELYELWSKATAAGEDPQLVAEFVRLINVAKTLHDDIEKLAKFFPLEV